MMNKLMADWEYELANSDVPEPRWFTLRAPGIPSAVGTYEGSDEVKARRSAEEWFTLRGDLPCVQLLEDGTTVDFFGEFGWESETIVRTAQEWMFIYPPRPSSGNLSSDAAMRRWVRERGGLAIALRADDSILSVWKDEGGSIRRKTRKITTTEYQTLRRYLK